MHICEQVAMAAMADVLIGVHGAGLVHLWWLAKKHATMIELEPRSQVGNPSFRKVFLRTLITESMHIFHFRTLTALSGKKYVSVRAEKAQSKIGKEPVSVNPSKVIDEVRKIVHAKALA